MPHLSPMSWLMMLLLLWISLMFIVSSSYFTYQTKFLEPLSKISSIICPKWKWLQGGRAMNNKL